MVNDMYQNLDVLEFYKKLPLNGLNKLRNNIYFSGFFIVCCERVLQP